MLDNFLVGATIKNNPIKKYTDFYSIIRSFNKYKKTLGLLAEKEDNALLNAFFLIIHSISQ